MKLCELNWVSMKDLSLVFSLFPAPSSAAVYYIVVVCCPSVLWLRKAPTDNRLLAGWWLRKATRGGVVMATEACQKDCVEIGQVWTHNHHCHPTPPPTQYDILGIDCMQWKYANVQVHSTHCRLSTQRISSTTVIIIQFHHTGPLTCGLLEHKVQALF